MGKKWKLFILTTVLLASPVAAYSQQAGGGTIPIPTVNFNVQEAKSPRQVALSLQILFLITIITLAPTLLIVLTSFVRVYIVLSFVSRGLATQNIPPNQVVVALALFLSLFIMFPTFSKAYDDGVKPYLDGKVTLNQGYDKAIEPIRDFMFKQTADRYIYRFIKLAKVERPKTRADVPTYVLIPAFILNELTISFYMGMIILIPFTVIDVVVASVLMSVGMMMLPPVMISFPLKILLFFLVDGWDLLVEKLVLSFHM
jgi:flagellar biosynthetic protein FliP